jgi:hypothetical protein
VIEVEDDPVESEEEFEDIDSDESIEEAEGYASLSEMRIIITMLGKRRIIRSFITS